MKLTENLRLPLPPADVAVMYGDPRYAQIRGEEMGANDASSRTDGDTAGEFTVSTDLNMPTDRVPDFARKFVGSKVTVREVQTWADPSPDGSRSGTTRLDVVGTPASMTATVTMKPAEGDATDITITGELVAKVPVLGPRLEKAALPYVSRVLKAEQDAAQTYRERSSQ